MVDATTYTKCYIASTSVAPWTTQIGGYGQGHPTQTAVVVFNNVSGTCDNFKHCQSRLQSNPDITGIGVIASFLIAAWATLLLLLLAYWGGLLPPQLLRNADRQLFSGNSRNSFSGWKGAVYHVTLILSDQQLVTGLAVLIAGYYSLVVNNLDIFHWQQVTYLAWLSSTVHLISLSILREQLNASRLLRNVRLAGMLSLLAMLLAALTPSTGIAAEDAPSQTPARCLWRSSRFPEYIYSFSSSNDLTNKNYTDYSSIVSYITLITSYLWKLAQQFRGSRNWVRTWGCAVPEAVLESAMKRCLLDKSKSYGVKSLWLRAKYRLLSYLYIFLVVWVELLDSFFATILLLLFTLTWGTVKLVLPRTTPYSLPSGEDQMTFGQLLPLLLLLQPALAILEHVASKKLHFRSPNSEARVPTRSPRSSSSKLSLRDVISESQLSSSLAKSDEGNYDPVIEHLYSSQGFRFLMGMNVFAMLGAGAGVLLFRALRSNGFFGLWILAAVIVGQQVWMASWCGITILFSRGLR